MLYPIELGVRIENGPVSFSWETLVLELAEFIENGCSRKRLDEVESGVFVREIDEVRWRSGPP